LLNVFCIYNAQTSSRYTIWRAFKEGQLDGLLAVVSRYENVQGRTRNKVRKCPVTAEESCPLKCHLIKQALLTN
jgi:hypothetical protein